MAGDSPTVRWPIVMIDRGEGPSALDDTLAVEEPLEIAVAIGDAEPRAAFTTMRTPGQDRELAAGWLATERIIARLEDLDSIELVGDPQRPQHQQVVARLAAERDLSALERHGWSSSACGICGRTAIRDALDGVAGLDPGTPGLPAERLLELPDRLAPRQRVFARTGAIHAAGLFGGDGELLASAEDIGRHNAVDAAIGRLLLEGRFPPAPEILLVSGRAGYEIVVKAARIGIPIVAAVGAPSSLATRLAEAAGITLVGFLRGGRCNVYTHATRIQP